MKQLFENLALKKDQALQEYHGRGLLLLAKYISKTFTALKKAFFTPIMGAVLFFTLCTFLFTYPSVFTFSTKFIGDGYDNYGFAISQYISWNQLKAGNYPFGHTTLFRYPNGFDFGVGADAALMVMVGAILLPLVGVVTAYNLTIVFSFVLNALGAFTLTRFLSKNYWAGLVAGVLYGFSAYTLSRGGGHLNLLLVAGFPFFLHALFRLKFISVRARDIFYLDMSAILITLGSIQYGLMMAVAFPVFALLSAVLWPKIVFSYLKIFLQHWKALLIIGVISAAIFLSHSYPYISALLDHRFQWKVDERKDILTRFNVEAKDLVIPNAYLPTTLEKITEQKLPHSDRLITTEFSSVFLGYVELLIVLLFLLSKTPIRQKCAVVLLAAFFLMLTLGVSEGGVALPTAHLLNIFPFSGVLETGRYVIFIDLLILISFGLLIKSLKDAKLVWILLPLILVGLAAERVTPEYFQSASKNDPYVQTIKSLPGKAVFNIPIDTNSGTYNILPAYMNKSIVDGYFHWAAETDDTKKFFFQEGKANRFSCNAYDPVFSQISQPEVLAAEMEMNRLMINQLQAAGIQQIIVHKDGIYYHPQCANIRTRVALLAPEFRTIEPTDKEVQTEQYFNNQQVIIHLFFPKEGVFLLDGAQLFPTDSNDMKIYINGQSYPLDWSTPTTDGVVFKGFDQTTQKMKDVASIKVQPGTIISLSSSKFVEKGYLSLWYRYVVNSDNPITVHPQTTVQKIYSDAQSDIYQINAQ